MRLRFSVTLLHACVLLLFLSASNAAPICDAEPQNSAAGRADAGGRDGCDEEERNIAPPLRPLSLLPVQVASSPRIFVVDNLFTREECETLIAAAQRNGMTEAGLINVDGSRKSDTTNKRRSLTTTLGVNGRDGAQGDTFLAKWRERMSAAAMLPESHAEPLAITQYVGGDDHKYELHFDSSLSVGRIATVLVFLTDVHTGGHLLFPWAEGTANPRPEGVSGDGRPITELEGVQKEPPIAQFCADSDEQALKIAPRVGRAVIFFSHTPDLKREGYRAMHAGCPPGERGEDKWIAQLFIKWHDAKGQNTLAQIMQAVNQPWREPLLK